jgi:hypothetical protein
MMMKILNSKVFYIDTYSQKSSHEMFNASLLLMCAMIFEKVDCRIGSSSYQNYLEIINHNPPKNINYKKIWVIEGNGRFTSFMRYLLSAILNIRYLIFSPKDVILIFPFNNLFSLRIINFINKFYKRNILIFCHGEMDEILTNTIKGGFLHRILTKLSHNFFLNSKNKISQGLYFSVLGDILKENIGNILCNEKSIKFISIDHPYLFKSIELHKRDNVKLKVGTVGVLNKIKGFYSFVEFVNKMNAHIRKSLDISVVGAIYEDATLLKDLNIELSSENNSLLDRDEFDYRIKQLDYILFFYPPESYRITASGAIFDAICYEKPILALKNDYFEYVFEKFGSFGFLFEDINEMIYKIQGISGNESPCIDFEGIKNKLTPEAISMQLKKELINIGFIKV